MAGGAQEVIELGKPIERCQQSRIAGSEHATTLQDLFLPGEFRRFPNGFGRGLGDPLARQQLFEPRQVFLGRRLLGALLSLWGEPRAHQQSLDESDMTECNRERPQTDRLETFDQQTDDFMVARHITHAHQLGADLKDFPSSSGVLLNRGPLSTVRLPCD